MPTEKEKNINPASLRNSFTYSNNGILLWKDLPKRIGYKQTMNAGLPAFTTKELKGYLSGRFSGYYIKAHRAIWAWHYGSWPSDQIDHINGNPSDNRIENLREVSNASNCRNQSKPKSNTSGWIGVSFHKQKGLWVAKYRKNYKDYHVGSFNCPTAAGVAVMIARKNAGFSNIHGR